MSWRLVVGFASLSLIAAAHTFTVQVTTRVLSLDNAHAAVAQSDAALHRLMPRAAPAATPEPVVAPTAPAAVPVTAPTMHAEPVHPPPTAAPPPAAVPPSPAAPPSHTETARPALRAQDMAPEPLRPQAPVGTGGAPPVGAHPGGVRGPEGHGGGPPGGLDGMERHGEGRGPGGGPGGPAPGGGGAGGMPGGMGPHPGH